MFGGLPLKHFDAKIISDENELRVKTTIVNHSYLQTIYRLARTNQEE